MCGRYALTAPLESVLRFLGLETTALAPHPPRYNIAPSQPVLVVRNALERRASTAFTPELDLMRWGLVPSWSKGPDARYSMINARAETMADKPAFRGAFRHRRCILPATAFYEWRHEAGGSRQPFAIRPADSEMFLFAGLWEDWQGPDGSEIRSVAIVTIPAPPALESLHDRAPLLIAQGDVQSWMTGDNPRPDIKAFCNHVALVPLRIYPVHPRVNNPRNDDPACLSPLGESGTAQENSVR